MPGKAVFLDYASLHPQDLDASCLQQVAADWHWREHTADDELVDAIVDAEVVVVNKVVLARRHLLHARSLKLICVAATGVNNIDLDAARELAVTVCNARGYATASVVQHVFALLLTLVTRLDDYRRDVRNGQWSRSNFFCLLDYPVRELQGMTLGIVGYGELGRAVAAVAEAFGMQVRLARRNAGDRRAGRVDLHRLLPQVDVLSLHCPLTADNHHLIGEEELALMRNDAILINTARGALVDEAALQTALQSGQIAGAALDGLAQEPPAVDHPLIRAALPNLIVTPHSAWVSREARQRLLQQVADNIRAFAAGRPCNVV